LEGGKKLLNNSYFEDEWQKKKEKVINDLIDEGKKYYQKLYPKIESEKNPFPPFNF
jgi:hypothetical protein